MRVLGYIVGAAMVVVGFLILTGFFQVRGMDPQSSGMLRTMFGIVLMLYGLYRFTMTDLARRREERE